MAKEGLLVVNMKSEKKLSISESIQGEPEGAAKLPGRTYDRVLYFAEQVLRQEGKTNRRNTLKGSSVIHIAKKKFGEAKKISDDTFYQHLLEAARNPKSKIKACGRPKGYYLAETVDKVPSSKKLAKNEANPKKGSNTPPKKKQQRSCSTQVHTDKSEMDMDMRTAKIVQKLQGLGKKYGRGSPPDFTIESHHRFNCHMTDGTTREITIVVRDEDISIFFRPNPPQWFEGNVKIEDVLHEIEKLLDRPN